VTDFATDPGKVPDDLRPDYYSKDDCSFFVLLTEFQTLAPGWPAQSLALLSQPDEPVAAGLQNQSNPLYVVGYLPTSPPTRHVWWVNQGTTFKPESDGGYVWAPQHTQAGYSVGHHTNVSLLRPGHVLVHYANSAIRALGVVTGMPGERAKPQELTDGPWNDAGHYAPVEYFPLDTPIPISEVPHRAAEAGPFTTGGDVKQGYLFPLDSAFGNELRTHFESRWPQGSPWARDAHRPSTLAVSSRLVKVGPRAGHQHVARWRRRHVDGDEIPRSVASRRSGCPIQRRTGSRHPGPCRAHRYSLRRRSSGLARKQRRHRVAGPSATDSRAGRSRYENRTAGTSCSEGPQRAPDEQQGKRVRSST